MKRMFGHISLLLALCALSACSSVTVKTDYDHSASFARYKTYRLEPALPGESLSPSAEIALANTLRTALAARGITEATAGKPDLIVARHVFLTDKISVQHYHDNSWPYRYGSSYRYGYYGMWAGAPRTYTSVSQYTQGTMVLDFVDSRTGKSVYRGVASAVAGGAEANAANISEAVKEIVEKMPTGVSQ